MKKELIAALLMSALGYTLQTMALNGNSEPVVLLHGLGRSSKSMGKLQTALQSAGFQVFNVAYPSRHHDVQTLIRNHVAPSLEHCFPYHEGRIHFVTHSMGGILVRQLSLDKRFASRIGRVVMMGAPNHGSEIIDHVGAWPLFRKISGPAGPQLGTSPDALPTALGPAIFETGILAGNISINPVLSLFLPGENDGKVSVASAKLEGMRDFRIVRSSHVFIMRNPKAIKQTVHFLNHGHFIPDT